MYVKYRHLLLVWQLFVFLSPFSSSSSRCESFICGAIFPLFKNVCWYTYSPLFSSLIYFIHLLMIVESLMQVHYAIGDLHVYFTARLLYKQRVRNRQHLMREYKRIGLQCNIKPLLMLNIIHETGRNVHTIPIKKSTIRE